MTGIRAESPLEGEERWARAAISELVEPANHTIGRMLAECGGVATLQALRHRAAGTDRDLYVRLPGLDVDRIARDVRESSARVVLPDDAEWPSGLDALEQPPYCLYVRGERALDEVAERSVAVVGARAASDYGQRVAAELGEGLAARGWVVVSGAAFGIDAAAHRGALAAGGDTVAVLACGVDRSYPQAHARLLGQIRQSGLVVSEVPPGAVPFPGRFLARNRIIAALARATVVVEASLRSGSLSTASEARRVHRPVGAVPGPVTSATSAGTHELVREHGAVLVTDVADVLDLAAPIGEATAPRRTGRSRATDSLTEAERRVWAAAPLRRWADIDRLAVGAGIDQAVVVRAVAVLQMLGLLEGEGDRWRKTRSGS